MVKIKAWKIFIVTLFVTIWFVGVCAAGEPARDVVFSETNWQDVPMGAEGSWVELYNRGDKTVDIGGYTVVGLRYAGFKEGREPRVMFTFPDGQQIEPKCTILVRFEEDGEDQMELGRRANSFYNGKVKHELAPDPPPAEFEVPEPSGGYCALFNSSELVKENMVDFLRWMQSTMEVEHLKWAVELGLWETVERTGSIAIRHPARGGKYKLKHGNPPRLVSHFRVLQRLAFEPEFDGRGSWALLPHNYQTPGRGNPFPAPRYVVVDKMPETPGKLQVGWSIPYNLSHKVLAALNLAPAEKYGHFDKEAGHGYYKMGPLEKWPEVGRLQIANDAHFHKIILDKNMLRMGAKIDGEEIPPGGYYARIKVENEHISTGWSEGERFEHDPRDEERE